MGCVHSCGVAIEDSGEERDNSNDGKRQDKRRAIRIIDKEQSKEKSFNKGDKSWDLDPKEEASLLKGSKLKDVKQASSSKATNSKAEGPSFLGKARNTGFFGPGSSNSVPKLVPRDGKILVLCFEVANTIFKAAKLVESLSDENVKHYIEVVFQSPGIQRLVSSDMRELYSLAAADKRKELEVFSREVVRFGNRCRDPQFHNLDRYFDRVELDKTQSYLKEIASGAMEYLLSLAQRTSNLYLEMYVLKKFEQDYEKKCWEEQNFIFSQKGDRAKDLKQQIENQKSYIKDLKKETLWSKKLEEVVGKLVDVVQFIHFEINRAFDNEGRNNSNEKLTNTPETLSSAGLALHYAHIITKIDNVVILQTSVPQALREALYMSLPDNIKASLKPKLLSLQPSELSTKQIRREVDKILKWLLPMANNTIKAQFGFGWVGEMANIRTEANDNVVIEPNLIRLQTLDHAKKENAEEIILDLLVLLHRLVTRHIKGSSANQTRSPINQQNSRNVSNPTSSKRSKNNHDTS
ncbi:Ikzf5 (DUF668) [Rhynchospora pubera]|uniref:Ikzf5 (DUF668) n=1 Tax=Rhynchospora pubera TaxID=906938 RepID=A0AAV8CBI0_9POAL|nr:Ikzf5 (DUF668) [Rhynchospora pubera]KAJ4795202.1 Ikzf5 (DUF668) [Rhynchospora pubera]